MVYIATIYTHCKGILCMVYIYRFIYIVHGLYAGWGFGKSCDEIVLVQMRVSFVGLAETETEAETDPDEQLRAVETQEKKK